MEFSIGYQQGDGADSFVELVRDYEPHVAEVYFPWAGLPSGRAALNERDGYVDWGAQERQESDLRALRTLGVRLNLLFNAACYGADAASARLENQVLSVVDRVRDAAGALASVTTTSPAVAHVLKTHAPELEVRASVNLRIGTVAAMRQTAHLFDAYCVQRDVNRDLARLAELRAWADAHGKRLSLLVNSGCLAHCAGQSYHDNLVAHEREAAEMRPLAGWDPVLCRQLLRDRANWPLVLQGTWIRPEDLRHYDGLVPLAKLATRLHDNPRLVVHAYVERRHRGNLLNLFEPSHATLFAPAWLDNDAFPEDWFARSTRCRRDCQHCTTCADVLAHILREGESTPG